MRLRGKTAIITGAAKGLGDAMAGLFAAQGADVIAVDVAEPAHSRPAVCYRLLDITDRDACRDFARQTIEERGKVDILVNNAGITRDGLTAKMTDEMWDQVINVNLNGAFNLTRYIGPHMQKTGGGSIINISSVVGNDGNIGQANYAASKAGVIGLTKTWAKEFAMKGGNVRVNAIAPGYTMTDILKTVPQNLLDQFAASTMLGRLAQPEEIACAALFLASDEASYITGQTLNVDGGMRL